MTDSSIKVILFDWGGVLTQGRHTLSILNNLKNRDVKIACNQRGDDEYFSGINRPK
jgi:hypothetical protein